MLYGGSGSVVGNSTKDVTITNNGPGIGSSGVGVVFQGSIGDGTNGKTVSVVQSSATNALSLEAATDYSGTTKSSLGVLRLSNLSAIRNSALDTTGSGTVTANAGLGNYIMGGLITGRDLASVVTGTPTNVTTLTLNPGTGKSNTYNNVIGNLSTGMNLTKTGAGTQILAGTNTYTGATLVSDGTLLVNGSITASSAVGVGGGLTVATLGGTGSITSAVTVNNNGVLAPGASIGKLTTTGDLTFTNGSTFAYEMNHSAVLPGDVNNLADLQIVNGNLILPTSGTANLTLFDTVAFAPNTTTLSLIQYTGTWNGGFFTYGESNVLEDLEEFDDTYGNHWKITYNAETSGANFKPGSDDGYSFVTLSNLTAIPEPGSLLALGCLIGSGAFLRSRRRR